MDDQRTDRARRRRVMQIVVIALAVLFWAPVTILATLYGLAVARPYVLLCFGMLGVSAIIAAGMLVAYRFQKPEK